MLANDFVLLNIWQISVVSIAFGTLKLNLKLMLTPFIFGHTFQLLPCVQEGGSQSFAGTLLKKTEISL